MQLINFEVPKLKAKFQLDVPMSHTFLQLFELILEKFNLNKSDFQDDKNSKLYFVYKSVMCRYERTIESYHINDESPIYVFIPKQIYNSFSQAVKSQQPVENIKSNEVKPVQITDNVLLQNKENHTTNEHDSVMTILNNVDKNNLKKLVEYGYDELDAAYALAYKITLDESLDFLNFGLASDLQIRNHIDKIINARYTRNTDDILRHSIEIIKVEGVKKGENVDVSVAATIGLFVLHTNIKNQNYKSELKDFIIKVQKKYPGQAEKIITNELQLMHGSVKFNPLSREFCSRHQDFNDLFGMIQYQNAQLEQNFGHNFNQFYSSNQGNIQKSTAGVQNKFSMIFNSLPGMSPSNYINPFEETFKDLNNCNHDAQDDFYYEYGRKLNYEQLMFLHRMLLEKNINIKISLQYLSAANGVIQNAELLINSF